MPWNEWPDDVLETTTNARPSSCDLMKSANAEVNLSNKSHQLHHTFQKLELFTCILRGHIPCLACPFVLHIFIGETIASQDPILVDKHSVQEMTPKIRRVIFDDRSTRGNDAIMKRCTFHVLRAFRC